jgi:hypothetical protein
MASFGEPGKINPQNHGLGAPTDKEQGANLESAHCRALKRGYLIGKIARHIAGKSLGAGFREEIAVRGYSRLRSEFWENASFIVDRVLFGSCGKPIEAKAGGPGFPRLS